MLLKLTFLIPLFPLIGSIINGFFGLKLGEKRVGLIACAAIALSFLTTVLVFIGFLMLPEGQHVYEQVPFTWMVAGDFNVDFGSEGEENGIVFTPESKVTGSSEFELDFQLGLERDYGFSHLIDAWCRTKY